MEREEGDRWLLAITCPQRQLVRENHVFPDELLLKSRLWLRGWIVSCACWPGLRGMYIETHLMRLSESRSAFTRGDFHLSSHHCGFLISKGLCCKHILFFQRALLTREGDCSALCRPKEGTWSSLNGGHSRVRAGTGLRFVRMFSDSQDRSD